MLQVVATATTNRGASSPLWPTPSGDIDFEGAGSKARLAKPPSVRPDSRHERMSGPPFTDGIKHASLDPSVATRTRSATSSRTPSRCSTRSTWSSSAPRSSTKYGAGSSRTPWAGAATRTDPLYKLRGLLRHGRENLGERQVAKLSTCLIDGDPVWEVTLAWHAYQQLRSIYQASTLVED